MLFDTNFLIELERETQRGNPGKAKKFLGQNREKVHAVSVISFGELAAGMAENQSARAFLATFRLVSLKPEVALEAANIDREQMEDGQRLGENDNWLAGTARYYGIPIVSNDAAFKRVRGLKVLSY